MKILRKLLRPVLTICLTAGTLLTTQAAGSRSIESQPDSTARALAAVMMHYLAPSSTPARVTGDNLKAYTEALGRGLSADPSDPSLVGLMEGLALGERLN